MKTAELARDQSIHAVCPDVISMKHDDGNIQIMTIDKPISQKISNDLELVPFTSDHLQGAWRLSQEVSWPHRLEDWALTLSVSKGVAVLRDNTVVGTSLCSLFGDVATLNMIVVDSSMRGRGLGRLMMEKVIEIAGPRELRLVATKEGYPLYEKMGFVACGEIKQHQGIVGPVAVKAQMRKAQKQDFPEILRMDLAASGMSREKLLSSIAFEDASEGMAFVADDGFAMLRRFGRGQVVGPVVANDTQTAKALISAAAQRCEGTFLRIDFLAEHELSGFIEALGLAAAGGGIRMKRAARKRDLQDMKTYALVSQALG
tara:strand:+ start:3921 stop:4868 length:948 start_codon:yes stop_codon:yes gene_type:complete